MDKKAENNVALLFKGTHYFVNAKILDNGKGSVLINCLMCCKSIRSHPQKRHFGIQIFTRHVKKFTNLNNVNAYGKLCSIFGHSAFTEICTVCSIRV